MIQDYSYGIIPLIKIDGLWQVFIIQHHSGHWSFPKGHKDGQETPLETAKRELLEETGLRVTHLWPQDPLKENYHFYQDNKLIIKEVLYFIAEVEGSIKLQAKEVMNGMWVPLNKASTTVTFQQAKNICHQLNLITSRA